MKLNLTIFKKKKSFKKGGFHTNPDICWELVLLIAFVIIIADIIFGFYLFMQINKEFIASVVDTSGQVQLISKARIDNVLQIFSTRATKSAGILSSPSPVVDPSL